MEPTIVSLAGDLKQLNYTTVQGTDAELTAFLAFHIAAGHICLPILLATFIFAKTVRRHPTLLSVCATGILSGIINCLLLYAGQERGAEPNHKLCMAQTILLYGVPPMQAVAVLCLVIHIRWPQKTATTSFASYLLLAAPYVVYITCLITTAVFAIGKQEFVNRENRFFYCQMHFDPLSGAMIGMTAIILVFSLGIELQVVYRLLRNRLNFRPQGQSRALLNKQFLLRVFFFSGYLIVMIALCVVVHNDPSSILPDMLLSTVGLALFVTFGTQKDILLAWTSWLPCVPSPRSTGLIRTHTSHTSRISHLVSPGVGGGIVSLDTIEKIPMEDFSVKTPEHIYIVPMDEINPPRQKVNPSDDSFGIAV